MCTGMLLNFHTVTRCPWRFAVRSSTERRITPKTRIGNVVPAGSRRSPARPVSGYRWSPRVA